MALKLLTPVVPSDHMLGVTAAPIQIVEYGDFECSHCWQAEPVLKDLLETYKERLQLVYRYMPLDMLYPIHPHATRAAQAAEAASRQGKFWEMHDVLFAYQDSLRPDNILRLAENCGVDMKKFREDIDDPEVAKRVERDFHSGVKNEVTSTPTFFVNSRRLQDSRDHTELRAVVASEAKKPKR